MADSDVLQKFEARMEMIEEEDDFLTREEFEEAVSA